MMKERERGDKEQFRLQVSLRGNVERALAGFHSFSVSNILKMVTGLRGSPVKGQGPSERLQALLDERAAGSHKEVAPQKSDPSQAGREPPQRAGVDLGPTLVL